MVNIREHGQKTVNSNANTLNRYNVHRHTQVKGRTLRKPIYLYGVKYMDKIPTSRKLIKVNLR